MTTLAPEWTQQPMTGTDMAAFVLAVLAVLYGALWIRDRERGMQWLAGGFALLAVYSAANDHHIPTGPLATAPGWSSLGLVSLMLITVGIVEYLGTPPRWRNWLLLVMLAPGAVLLLRFALGIPTLRAPANFAATIVYVGTAVLAFMAARREPGAGHGFVAVSLLATPGVVLVAMLMKVDTTVIRYFGTPPVLFFGMTLLTASLLRRRRALEAEVLRRTRAEAALTELNTSLEEQVTRRTADLQNMLLGLESFNRSVSHDLRGPLGGIAGLARLAHQGLERGDDTIARSVLPEIANQAETSTKLVSALLELARVGDASLQLQPVSLNNVVSEAVNQLALANPTRSMSVISVHDLPVVKADFDILRPVFVNLLSNALKFVTGRRDARIEVGAYDSPSDVTVFVRDNGVGFDSERARTLFEPFVRLHGAQFGGHGVGLSIVRRAVERHGGRVWVESAPEQGACFFFTLPKAA